MLLRTSRPWLATLVLLAGTFVARAGDARPTEPAARAAATKGGTKEGKAKPTKKDAKDASTKQVPAKDAGGSAKQAKATAHAGESPPKQSAGDADEADAGSDPPRRVTSLRHVNIRARDLRLSNASRDKLARIAERYHEAVHTDLIVTGGTRSTKRQAELMIAKLENGDDIEALYEQKAAAKEIVAAYRSAQGDGKKKRRVGVLEHVEGMIDAQVARGVYVSRHLQSGATDVRSRGMTPAQEKALRAAVAAEPGVSLLDEREAVEPHFHLNL